MAEDIVIRTKSGVPVEADFQNIVTRDGGFTRIYMVVDTDTGVPYTRLSDGTIVAVALGTGTATGTNTGDVTLAGETYLSIAGQVITAADINLTTHVTGTLPVGSGGTGLTAGTSGGVLYYSGAGTLASSALLGSTQVVLGGGAGAAPNTSANLTFSGSLLVLTGAQTISTTLGVGANAAASSTYVLDVAVSQTSETDVRVKNASSGTGVYAQFVAESDGAVALLGAVGTGTAGTGLLEADYAYVASQTSAAGLNVGARTGSIKFYAGGWAVGNLVGTAAAAGWTIPGTLDVTGVAGFGGASSSARGVNVVNAALTSTGPVGVFSAPIAPSTATDAVYGFWSAPTTANASFTVGSVIGHYASDFTKGAASTVTNQFGFFCANQTQGATLNVAYATNISSGTGKWAVRASGTADSAFAGNVRIGSTAAPTVALDVTGAILASTTITATGDLAVNGGDLTSSATTFNLLNATVTTLNVGGGVTGTLTIGNASGTTVHVGAQRMSFYGAGAATFDASGNITSVSDEAQKRNVRPFTRGLADIVKLVEAKGVILYGYKPETGLDQSRDDYAGYSANVVQKFLPEAVGQMNGSQGQREVIIDKKLYIAPNPKRLTLNPFVIQAAHSNALAEINRRLSALEARR